MLEKPSLFRCTRYLVKICSRTNPIQHPLVYNRTMSEGHTERFVPVRKKLDQLSIVKDYATVPRLEYR
jgi:hypothetical protein